MSAMAKVRRVGVGALAVSMLSALSFGAGAAMNPDVEPDIAKHRYTTGQQVTTESTGDDGLNRLDMPRYRPGDVPSERADGNMYGPRTSRYQS